MTSLRKGWNIQTRVIGALMIRELTTRFGRENIGFLWIMAEPMLFAGLVGILWSLMKGPVEHGISVVAFVVSGYIPLTLFRNSVNRSISLFVANGSLMYHRQVKILDFIFVRFLIEMIGCMMGYLFIAILLYFFGFFPMPADIGLLIAGYLLYSLFTLSICFLIAPLSEMSEALEKFMPVVTYIIIPVSGTFNMASWLTPAMREVVLWSPLVNAMEMMRSGIFGDSVTVYYDPVLPIVFSLVFIMIGLMLCRRVRKTLIIE